MKQRRILAVVLALAIAAGVFVFFSTRKDNSRGMVTLWYEKGSPLAGEIEKLAESYNSDMARETLPVETKCFETEEALAEAYETGTPDILLCSHLRAFSLHQREKLTDISEEANLVPPAYPKSIQSRNSSIGRSFFPLGLSVPVLAINNSLISQRSFASFEEVFSQAAFYTKKTGKPFLVCDNIPELGCVYMLRFGEEFDGKMEDISGKPRLLSLYNTFAEAAFDGCLSFPGEDGIKAFTNGAVPCIFTDSEKLSGIDLATVTVCALPSPEGSANSDTVGTAYGFAVTNGGCRSKGDTAAFISWVFSEKRSVHAALDSMLSPLTAGADAPAGTVQALLNDMVKDKLVTLPSPDSDYIRNKTGFEESFQREMERLLP